MEPYPRAIVSVDVMSDDGRRTITIIVPLLVEPATDGGRLSQAAEDLLLDAMRDALGKVAVELQPDASVTLQRLEGDLCWCRISRPGDAHRLSTARFGAARQGIGAAPD
jgi:hypothetical protein